MLDHSDQLRSRFTANDAVGFTYRNQMLVGLVVRTNPKRAVIQVGTEEFRVPYAMLQPKPDVAEERENRIASILETATALMEANGLHEWQFQFDHSTRRAGCCNYRDKTISISFHLAHNGADFEILDTILHEIAHALVGKEHNHDAVWKAKARAIGCSGNRTHRMEFSTPKWKVRCENDCWSHTAQRRNPRLVCRECGGKLVYSAC